MMLSSCSGGESCSAGFEREDPARLVTPKILDRICYDCGGDRASVVGPRRTKSVVAVRRKVAKRLRDMGLSYPEIGFLLGGRDHTTIMHLVNPERRRRAA
jgi:chromosomal replication initiation ATPase DnaA